MIQAITALAAGSRRVVRAAVLLLAVSALLFAATEVLPGDPALVILGQSATPERLAALRAELNLDTPAPLRYLHWITSALRGDLGESVGSRRPVAELIGDRLVESLILAAFAFAVVIVVSLALGLWTGSRPGGRTDPAASTTSMLFLSVPEFVVAGLLVTVISFWLRALPPVSLVPPGGTALDRPVLLVLPVLSLSLPSAAWATRLVRGVVLDTHRLPHVEAARLGGLSEVSVLGRHLLPSALAPVSQVFAALTAFLVGGSVVVENIFSYPGLGTLLTESVATRNLPVVQGVGLLLAGAVTASFLLADLVTLAANRGLRRTTS